jgi:hypothetical protein
MKTFRAVVVAVILGSFFSPAMGVAKAEPRLPAAATQPAAPAATTPVAANTASASRGEAANYAAREQQSKDVQDFKGGAVYVYFGSGVVLALIIIILILL